MANLSKITLPNNQTYDLRDSNLNGHVVQSDVPADAVFTDTTYNIATTSTNGLMSAADKSKLDNIDNFLDLRYTVISTF